MTNTRTILGAMAWAAVSCLLMLGALEPVGIDQAAAPTAQHAIF